jgi:DNA polymerase
VTDARELLRRYLEQQIELGQPAYVLDGPADRRTGGPIAPMTEAAEPPTANRQPPTATGANAQPPARRPASPSSPPAIPGQGIVVPAPPQDLFAADPLGGKSLPEIERLIHACTRCGLHAGRKHAVPGEGPLDAKLVVVGEGPGATEDETGRPFVGRAGDLLTDILAAIGCPRETVYICNVVKCRPPENRKPMADEMEACLPYLHRQLAIIGPKVILAMGTTAAEALLNTKASLTALRNKVHDYRGTPLVVTYHPAALLRNPHWKRPTWDDVRIARQLLDR